MMHRERLLTTVMLWTLGLGVSATAAAGSLQAPAKKPGILVLMHKAVDGPPIADARMKHFALPDPRLQARLEKLGYQIVVAPYASGMDMSFLQQFNVVVVPHVYIPGQAPELDSMVAAKNKLLLDYVKSGGGLLVMRAAGWQFGKDIEALNQWLAPCDISVVDEQVIDDDNKVRLESRYVLSWTGNVVEHPVTEGVRGIFYTTYFNMYTDSTSPVRAGDEWTVLIRGMKTAKSLRTVKGKETRQPAVGAYSSAPPLLAVRDFGKGRIAVWPINATCVWQDGYHVLWGRGLTMEGERGGMAGDAARLMENLVTYLAAPSRGRFGGYRPPRPPAQRPEAGFAAIAWDRIQVSGPSMPNCYLGLIGVKSSLSSGTARPEAYIRAARSAGYQFVAFTEDLEKLTASEFGKLQQVCAANSTEDFKAYPGFAYLDESGNQWATFSDRLRWPEEGWWSRKHRGRLAINNPLSRGCQWPPVVLVKAHANPEPPWFQGNFKVMSLYTYEGGKLVDDSLDLYMRLQRMRFLLAPVAVHFVTSPDQIAAARNQGYQSYVRWFDSNPVQALSGHIGRYKDQYVFQRSSFVSQGPVIEDCRIVNFGSSDLAISGNDRFRVHLQVSAPAGLREVALYEADEARPWRRFLPGGKKTFETTFDHFHDRQYDLILCATDVAGNKAVGWDAWTGVQENSFPRCSDNINTMPRGKWCAGTEKLQNVRGIENYLISRNWECIGLPTLADIEETARPAVQYYPRLAGRFGTLLDCIIEHHYPPTIDGNRDRNDRPERAMPNEVVSGTVRHTLFTPHSDGPLVQLVEGDFTFKQAAHIRRAQVMAFSGRAGADVVCATRKDGGFFAGKLAGSRKYYLLDLPAGGFAAVLPQPFHGSVGMIPLQEGIRGFAFDGGGGTGQLRALLGKDNRDVETGDRMTYRYFGIISKLDPSPDSTFVTDVRDRLGLHGQPAYSVTAGHGEVVDTKFVLRLRAHDGGFSGRISRARLPLHLPVVIEGLNPRWDAAIWYAGQNRFDISEWVVNEMNQRYVVRRQRTIKDDIRHFPVMSDGTGMLQIDTTYGDRNVFIGHPLVSDNPAVCLTLTDTRPDRAAFDVHNPTDQDIDCSVKPGPGFALLGKFEKRVSVPAGSTQTMRLGG